MKTSRVQTLTSTTTDERILVVAAVVYPAFFD